MASNRSIDYVAKDFDSIVDALIAYATINFGPDTSSNRQWTDFNVDDFSRTWLELLAYVGDLVFYYLDVQATQSNLETATIRSAVLNIAKQFGYVVPTATSASGLAKFTLTSAQTVPVGFRLSSTNGAQFFVASATTQPGSTSLQPILQVVQGEQKQDTFIAKGVQNEELILNFIPLVKDTDNSIALLKSPRVTVNANAFDLVETFVNSLPTDKHYRLFTDPDGRTILRFGDGIFGEKLDSNDSVIADYRVGGGTVGNIAADTLTTLVDSSTFIQSVTNSEAFSGGADEPSTDRLRGLVPAHLKTLERAVALQDYADIVLANFPSVSKAAAERNIDDPGVDINVYIVPSGTSITPITSNPSLLNNIGDYLDERKPVTTVISIRDAFAVDTLFKLEMFLQNGISRSDVAENVTTLLETFFNLESGDVDGSGTKFGQTILINDLYDILATIEGVDRFELKKFHYRPRVVVSKSLGANYIVGEVKLFPTADDSEWLIAPNYSVTNPEYISYTAFKKIRAAVTNLSEDSLSDDTLNFSAVESSTSAINIEGAVNQVFDSTKTFLTDEFVGGSDAITITNVSGNTWDFSGAAFTPRNGDRVQQGSNFAFIKQIIDVDTFLLSSGAPGALSNGAATMIRDEYLFIDAANNIWTIEDNDAHSLVLSQFAINNVIISDVAAGEYKVVKSLIGANLVFRNLTFQGIDYNTHNTFYRLNSNFNLVGTISDEFQISRPQQRLGNFGVNVTIDSFSLSTPTPGKGRVHFAGAPDFSGVTVGTSSDYVLIDNNKNIFEIVGVNNVDKTVDILHQSGTTVNPMVSGGSPASICQRYYSDNNEISFAIGISNLPTGLGFQALGSITTVPVANIVDGETFVLNDGVNPIVTFEFNKVGTVAFGNVEVDLITGSPTTANDVRDRIITAISGAPLLAISGSIGGASLVALQNDSLGTQGNQNVIEGVADAGFTVIGMSGGLNSGSIPTPIIPGPAQFPDDLGFDNSGNSLDHFEFRISGFADDVVNLRKNEIPQFDSDDLELDLRGGVV